MSEIRERLERAEKLAEFFHITYELLAPTYGYETKPDTRTRFQALPENNRRLMIAVCEAAIKEFPQELAASVAQQPQLCPHGWSFLADCSKCGRGVTKAASAPVQEEKCPTCHSPIKAEKCCVDFKHCPFRYDRHLFRVTDDTCIECTDSWHSSGISEVSQPSAEQWHADNPCNHEVGRMVTCRLGTLGCSIHEPKQKVAEPTRIVSHTEARETALKFIHDHFHRRENFWTVKICIPREPNDSDAVLMDYIEQQEKLAEQAASLRSQLEEASKYALAAIRYCGSDQEPGGEGREIFAVSTLCKAFKQDLEVAESALRQTNADHDLYVETTNEMVGKLEADLSAMRSRESVIDYEALANEIVAHALDHTKSTRNVIGEISVRLKNLTEQVLRSHDQKLRGRESVEKGLLAAVTKISNSYRDCGLVANDPGKELFYDSLFTELNAALTSYRQATQPEEK